MQIIHDIQHMEAEFIALRHHIHSQPELGFEEHKTSAFVASKLKEYGYEVYEHIGRTGVVGVLKKGEGTKKIGLRADMDALPIQEESGLPYASTHKNRMHACGHDGHTASLLFAAKYLSQRDFTGTLNLYFQPAEEGLGGAQAMITDGLFERFDSDYVFGWHNVPLATDKTFFIKEGAMMASADKYTIDIGGTGGHGSAPDKLRDPIYAASLLIIALQGIVSRAVDPQNAAVLSVGSVQAGDAFNVVPDNARLLLSVRALDTYTRDLIESRIRAICAGIEAAQAVSISIEKDVLSPVTENHAEAVALARQAAESLFGAEACEYAPRPLMASEDFGFFCEQKKCAYAFFENGNDIYLHNSRYVFSDALLSRAAAWYSRIVLDYLV